MPKNVAIGKEADNQLMMCEELAYLLDNKPFPLFQRKNSRASDIRQGLKQLGMNHQITDCATPESSVAETIKSLYPNDFGPHLGKDTAWSRAIAASVNLCFSGRDGEIIRATDALEALLCATHTTTRMPITTFRPPHSAVYVGFGPRFREKILPLHAKYADDHGRPIAIPFGCYVFESNIKLIDGTSRRVIGIYLGIVSPDPASGVPATEASFSMLGWGSHLISNEDAPIWDDFIVPFSQLSGVDSSYALINTTMDMVNSIFLYMRSEDAIKVTRQSAEEYVATKSSYGDLDYQWTQVGPETLPGELNGLDEVPSNWRCGDFLVHSHDEPDLTKKVVFIKPHT